MSAGQRQAQLIDDDPVLAATIEALIGSCSACDFLRAGAAA